MLGFIYVWAALRAKNGKCLFSLNTSGIEAAFRNLVYPDTRAKVFAMIWIVSVCKLACLENALFFLYR
jgi:hypothetical protein